MLPTKEDIREAAARIAPAIVRTPLLEDPELSARIGAPAFIKPESLQRFGAFKIRGAYNKIAALSDAERANGVLAYSSGNHAIAVAAAARMFGIPAVIIMPADAPGAKLARTRALGAEVVTYERVGESREAIGERIARERGLPTVKPFDDPLVMAGQGTIGLEVAAALDERGVGQFTLVAPASGGGLAGGIAIALDARAAVIAVEPEGHDDLKRSVAAGKIVSNALGVRSICDALMVERPSARTLEAARTKLAAVETVSDDEVRAAMRHAFHALKLVIEPGGAAGLAYALSPRFALQGEALVVVASGGNVDAAMFASALAQN